MYEDKVAILVKRASLEFEKMSNPRMAEHGLTGAQYRVLKYLYLMQGKPVRTVDIERYYSLTHPTTIGLLDALEKKGYVVRRPNPADARSRVVDLTQKALGMKDELEGVGDELEAAFTKNLSDKERERLIALLMKMMDLKEE